jgi:hypothetical protein
MCELFVTQSEAVADPGSFERGCGSGEGRGDYDKNTIFRRKIARK